MEKLRLTVLSFSVFVVGGFANELNIEGYYWRDFTGEVPKDALAGRIDCNGNPIYMGQILHEGRLSPAKIYPNDNKAYYGFHGAEQTGTEFIKILCTKYPERFYWIPTIKDKIHLLTNHHLIIGGRHPEKTMYFGRIRFRNETTVGKVSTGTNENLGLYITQDGKEFNFPSFEMLSYKKAVSSAGLEPATVNVY